MSRRFWVIPAGIVFLASVAQADKVRLVNTVELNCQIMGRTPKALLVRLPEGEKEIPINDVYEIAADDGGLSPYDYERIRPALAEALTQGDFGRAEFFCDKLLLADSKNKDVIQLKEILRRKISGKNQ